MATPFYVEAFDKVCKSRSTCRYYAALLLWIRMTATPNHRWVGTFVSGKIL